jgi:major membrane immunogen (membrane-anchored lipoprotein)
MMRLPLICCSAVLLSACGEVDQSKSAGRHLPDVAPYQGAKNSYVAKGWTPGDKNAWETQLRTRSQSQNEYVKTN